jgi:predicted DNA-binding transcriptional regulator YafY
MIGAFMRATVRPYADSLRPQRVRKWSMADTTSRALALLDLLQRRKHWTGAELARRLGTTERTLRRDVDRLRGLGYRIDSAPGHAGGYRLDAGAAVPPLLLSEDEAVAIAVGLRVAAAEQLVDGTSTALSAIAKLEQILAPAQRRKVNALAHSMTAPSGRRDTDVSPDVLGAVALACRDHERVRFGYTDGQGQTSRRHAEPHALAPARGRWYLVAWDLDRDDWRTFRLDRLADLTATGARFEPRPLTAQDIAERILIASVSQRQPVEGHADIAVTMEDFRKAMGVWADGATTVDAETVRWPFGGSDVRDLFYALSWIPRDLEFTVAMPADARDELRAMLERALSSLVE